MTEADRAEQGMAETLAVGTDEDTMLREVLAGLQRAEKRISSKYHYDELGSQLFEEITRLEEYYPTRTERALLVEWMPTWVRDLGPRALVELGAGSAGKSRIILDAMVAAGTGDVYVPVDVSHDFLHDTAEQLRPDYPSLEVLPTVADITAPVRLPPGLPAPTWIAFLGSTLGNFDQDDSAELLSRIRHVLRPDDRFLLGVDLRPGPHKSAERIALAYNDPSGVTARFSLNVLAVINDQLGSDFDLAGYRHSAVYSVERGRIETSLESRADQTVRFPGGEEIRIAAGERIRTEISCKYDRPTVDELFGRAQLEVVRWVEDEKGYYALVLGAPLDVGA